MTPIQITYFICIILSIALCFWYFAVDVRRSIVQNIMLLVMLIANIGYFSFSISHDISAAILSAKIEYVGACYLPILFFLTVCEMCHFNIKSLAKGILIAIQSVLYCLVCTIGYMDIYYKSVDFKMIDGVATLLREYGAAHIMYPITLGTYIFGALIIALYTMLFRKNVDRDSVVSLLVISIITSGSYVVRVVFNIEVDYTPVIYILMMTGAVISIYRTDIYDVTDNENVIKEQLSDVGFLTFESGMKYMGGNECALNLFPDLRGMPVGRRLSSPPEELESTFEKIELFLEDRKKIGSYCCVEGDNIKVNDRTYETVIHSLQNHMHRCVGATIEIRDITDHTRMLELKATYNEKLEKEVEEKTSQIRSIQERTILGMAQMVESRDLSTGGHIKRTSAVVRIFAKKLLKADMGFDEHFLKLVIRSAPMHDLGKIGVDDAVLRKQGKFTDEEYEKMKKHSEIGGKMVTDILSGVEEPEFVKVAFNVANFHHEKVNGKGYPMGLVGDMIPIEARIMALADVFDALVSKRCYKDAFTYEKAFNIITEDAGTHFDPKLVPIFLSCRDELEEYYNNNDH